MADQPIGMPIQAPANTIICIAETDDIHQAIVSALTEARFLVEVFHGEAGLVAIDPTGEQHGLLGRAWRSIQKLISETDHITLEAIEAALKNDQYVLVASTEGDNVQRDAIHDIMKNNGGIKIFWAGTGVIELLSGWGSDPHMAGS